MNSNWEPILKDVISKVLESMFFTLVDFDEAGTEEQPFDYESEIHLINFELRRVISLKVSEGFARTITANLLGIEEEAVDTEDIEDCLREFANMVGGAYHVEIKDPECWLGIPQVRKIAQDEKAGTRATKDLFFGCLGEPAGSATLAALSETAG